MELYLDTVKIEDVKAACKLGIIDGVTTTPTFMRREGIDNPDSTILEIASMVPVIQIEALGRTKKEIINEVTRLETLGLSRDKTVYKIPMANVGISACSELVKGGFKVNLHLVYTLQQAYLAMKAGATYVCPLIGRLQDQGIDGLEVIKSFVEMKRKYKFNSEIMFSSVRNSGHIRSAIEAGADVCTIPWSIMEELASNSLTELHTEDFYNDSQKTS